MIEVESYTCAECGSPVEVVGIVHPTITRSCEHADAVVHANMSGTVYARGSLDTHRLRLDEIPEMHRAAFLASEWGARAWTGPDGEREWVLSDFYSYIEQWRADLIAREIALEAIKYGGGHDRP